MPTICYESKSFRDAALVTIAQANDIIREYQAMGYELTLRQLYYQFVARGLIPNEQRQYKRLGKVLSDARLAGLVDWNAIVDRTRNFQGNTHWDSLSQILEGCAQQFRYDLWEGQERRVEVWIEKEALIGVVERPCVALDIDFFACRGYVSQSEQWRAGERFRGCPTVVLHLGDHDPSGVDMTRDNADRLALFSRFQEGVEVRRIALNMPQVEELQPPENPAKLTDSRAVEYIAQYGDSSWELDALPPDYIDRLIRDEVAGIVDQEKWDEQKARQDEARRRLRQLADEWDEDEDLG